jgi:transcriptional regulator with XRE-family HTH domain
MRNVARNSGVVTNSERSSSRKEYNNYVIFWDMVGEAFQTARKKAGWTQARAAQRLGVTQAYLSMVESGTRPVSSRLARAAAKCLPVAPADLALRPYRHSFRSGEYFKRALGALGYEGFAYLRPTVRVHPAVLLMQALDSDELDARVLEALPWLASVLPAPSWEWLTAQAKLRDRQNRLAYATQLSREMAERRGDARLAALQQARVAALEPSRLAKEDTLCHTSITRAEAVWLRNRRGPCARHWNLLTDLCVEQLHEAFYETSA